MLKTGKVPLQVVNLGAFTWTLEEVRELQKANEELKTEYKVLRLPSEPEGKFILREMARTLCTWKRAGSRKEYFLFGPLSGSEQGIDYLLGIYPTIPKEHCPGNRLCFILHLTHRTDLRFKIPIQDENTIWD